VDVSEDVYGGATDLVREQLGYEVARYVFGRPAEFRRQAEDDAQMQMALKLLRSAETPKDLLSLATRQATTTARAGN
jgi:hypothetical protein